MARSFPESGDSDLMSGFCDIHAHVLPGIDDGPPNRDKALTMLRAAAGSGVATIAATPHLRSDFPDVEVTEIAARCASMRELAESEGIDIELVCGAEVSVVWALEAGSEDIRLATYGQRGTDMLVETPSQVAGLDRLLFELRVRGLRLVLAHPERSPDFQHDPSPLVALVEQGILLQINADTLLGDPRRQPASRLGARLCRDGMVHALASDGHRGESWRPVTQLARAVLAAAELVGPERARWMAAGAPAAILAGRDLPPAPPILQRRRKMLGWARR